jgi:hypothetical protein
MIARKIVVSLIVAGTASTASTQIALVPGVFATGGGMLSNGTYAAAATIGQSVIGRSVSPTFAASAGFWGDGAVILDVGEPPPSKIPGAFALRQNYPNPFNPTTRITYDVPEQRNAEGEATEVHLVVYDLLGREVAVLVHEQMTPGSHAVQFDAHALATGVYVYRMSAGTFVQTRRMMLVK